MLEQKFKSGDVVSLKSGGQTMTVDHCYLTANHKSYMVQCVWFDGSNAKKANFSEDAITGIEQEKRDFYAG